MGGRSAADASHLVGSAPWRWAQDPQGQLWDAVLDGNPEAVKEALDKGASLQGPPGSFEAITSR